MKSSKCIIPIKINNNSSYRLICFPHAGGGASFFKEWIHYIDSTCDLYAIQLPGREERFNEKHVTSVDVITATLIKNMYPILFSKPYIFFGHSLGGLISFELAKAIYFSDLPAPKNLIISSCKAPSIKMVKKLSKFTDDDLINYLKSYNAFPKELLKTKKILAQIFLPYIRSDFLIIEKYKYKKPIKKLPFPITAFFGNNDKMIKSKNISMWHKETNVFDEFLFEGDHFYFRNKLNEVLFKISQLMYDKFT